MKPKILFINSGGDLGGAEFSLLGLLAGLHRQNYHLGLACPVGSELAQRALKLPIAVAELPLITSNLLQSPREYMRGMLRIWRLITMWKPDVIHGNGVRSTQYAVPLGILTRTPTVLHIRDVALPPSRLTRMLMRRADVQIAVSHAVAENLRQHGLCARHCPVIYNGIDLDAFDSAAGLRASTRANLGLQEDHLAVGIVGRLLSWKGQQLFIEVAHQLRELPHVHWLIIGEEWPDPTRTAEQPQYRQQLADRIDALGLGDRVILLGRRDNIPAIMNALDIVLVPSMEPEPFGRVAVEAMAASKPVIVSDAGGLSEIVPEGIVGYRVPTGNVALFAERVRTLIDDPQKRYEFGLCGSSHAQSCFSLNTYVDKVVKVYKLMSKLQT